MQVLKLLGDLVHGAEQQVRRVEQVIHGDLPVDGELAKPFGQLGEVVGGSGFRSVVTMTMRQLPNEPASTPPVTARHQSGPAGFAREDKPVPQAPVLALT